ncbi:CXXC-type zinc finger protein 1-like [Planococcus citri]|uniref:CXXC-type zinc finger protein 1-like n=1 Tax=Planococcus citri TaxID=170843 RepID=UPI0031F890A8
MSSSRLSKEEIAKQFMLPERKSKIATLLKQDGQEYCICRSSDSSSFMIACDACEDWYHGDCIGISQKESKYIKHYFCDRCRAEDPSLKTRFKPGSGRATNESPPPRKKEYKDKEDEENTKHRGRRKHREANADKKSSHKKRSKQCGQCENCLRPEDCGRCSNCKKSKKSGDHVEKCIYRQCISSSKSGRRKRRDSNSEFDISKRVFDNNVPRQCYGPECIKEARPSSKYCSDECGMKLAYARLYHILPARVQERNFSTCYAELNNKRDLVEIKKKQVEVRDILRALDKRHKELDAIQEHAKQLTVINDSDDEQEDEAEIDMYCITCGHQIHTRTAIKHMEKCFNKYESQSSFCSVQKTRIDGNNMFCDFYNPTNQTYCKRLRVLCPEHYKDPKINDNEVCGFPLVTNVFVPTGEYCRVSQKQCLRHYCWAKLRRAEIDMERVRQWLKLDELVEQEHQMRNFLLARTGVLNLMLHSTYDHELMSQLQIQSQQARRDNEEAEAEAEAEDEDVDV